MKSHGLFYTLSDVLVENRTIALWTLFEYLHASQEDLNDAESEKGMIAPIGAMLVVLKLNGTVLG